MSQPRSDVFAASLGADLVIFDALSDRYLAMRSAIAPGELVDVKASVAGRRLTQSADEALVEAGLFQPGPPYETPELRLPLARSSASDPVFRGIRASDVPALVFALVGCFVRLRRKRPCTAYARADMAATASDEDPRLAAELAVLRTLRLLLPMPIRCLPASLITALFLRRKRLDATIVFGVRSHPFEAHCWVEHRGRVLDEDVERVLAFTPIAVGRP